jgi:hypothetical protein
MELSVSKAGLFNLCEMRYYLERVEGWKLVKEPSWLAYGTGVDQLLEVLDNTDLETALSKVSDYFTDEYTQVDVSYLLTLWKMQYIDVPFAPITLDGQQGNQFHIYKDLGNNVTLNGYVDKVHMYNEQVGFTERKTTSSPINETSVYWDKLWLDPQISAYAYGLTESHTEPVNLCCYEVLRKPNKAVSVLFDRSKASSVDEYKDRVFQLLTKPPKQTMIARKKVFITSDRMEWWKHEHLDTAERMIVREEQFESRGPIAYRRNPNSCDAFGGCPFRKFCSGRCDLDRMEHIKQEKE